MKAVPLLLSATIALLALTLAPAAQAPGVNCGLLVCAWINYDWDGGCVINTGQCWLDADSYHRGLLPGFGVLIVDGWVYGPCEFGANGSCHIFGPSLTWNCYSTTPLIEAHTWTPAASDHDVHFWNPC